MTPTQAIKWTDSEIARAQQKRKEIDNRRGIIILTYEDLAYHLDLPDDVEIFGIKNDLARSQVQIMIRHPDLPPWKTTVPIVYLSEIRGSNDNEKTIKG